MPELPEVEVTMRGVSPALKGSVIKSVFKGEKKLRIPLSDDLYQLKDAKVLSLKRRGKYIIVTTTKGSIIVHLGMSGHLKVVDNEKDCYKHEAELIKEYASKGFDMYNIQGICKEEETRTYTMRIDVELYKKLEEEAVRRRRSVNFIVNEKIERAYKKQKKK